MSAVRRGGGAVIEVAGQAWALTRHALVRAVEMGIEAEQIREALAHPDEISESRKYADSNSRHYRLGNFALSVAFNEDIPVVVTVVWATQAAWNKDLANKPEGYDRELREFWRK